jgi:glycosyltransferase involved in cell wall biosynthesis
MRIAMVVCSLEIGGTQRLCVNMANHWAGRHELSILTVTGEESPEPFGLVASVRVLRLGVARPSRSFPEAFANNFDRVRALRRQITALAPDVVLSFGDTTNVLVLLAMLSERIPVVAYEQSDPYRWDIGFLWKVMRRVVYRTAGAVIVLNAPAQRYFAWLGPRLRLFPNPVVVPRDLPPARREKKILSMGRFTHEKGFDLLIDAFARMCGRFSDWSLEIAGGGPLLEELRAKVRSLGLESRAHLPGRVDDPFERFLTASVFACPSRFEGFPLTLCEAMACGLPPVCFDSEWAKNIVRSGENGLLVAPLGAQSLADGLAELVDRPERREALAREASRVVDSLGMERVLPLWEKLIDEVRGARP